PVGITEDAGDFSLAGGVAEAFRSIPEGLRGPESEGPPETSESAFQVMRTMFDGPAAAYAYLLFILIYAPCVAAIAAIYKETSLAWAAFSTAYLTVLAWTVSTLFYRLATFHRSPGESLLWLVTASLVAGGVWLTLKGLSKAGKPGI
ncbi:MAG TPA: nucleoside recognition domain-containing protein, partial [Candidatus Sabulitectum sp.]|nr:nucleoside recognition domain-containing protein [Candidatus Sabulitectum sp.]